MMKTLSWFCTHFLCIPMQRQKAQETSEVSHNKLYEW